MATLNDLDNIGASAKMWVSDMTVSQWEAVISPLDGEVYRRKTAGSGTTDPADDVTNYIAVSYVRSTALPLKSSAWASQSSGGAVYYASNIVKTSPGTIANGVRTSILSLAGRGGVGFIGLQSSSAGSTFRLEIVCDGRTIYDSTAAGVLNGTITLIGDAFQNSTVSNNVDGWGVPNPNGPRFRRTFQVFLTPTVGTFLAAGVLAASYWSES